MPHVTTTWTAARVRLLPEDGQRHEVIDGELIVTPAPTRTHQRVVGKLLMALTLYLQDIGGYEVLSSPADVELDPRTLVQPDLFVTRITAGEPDDWEHLDLQLVIEVLSPSTARQDRLTKRTRYQRQGIEYWIVDLDARVVERWAPSDDRPEILATSLTWRPDGSTAPLVFQLERFFAETLGR